MNADEEKTAKVPIVTAAATNSDSKRRASLSEFQDYKKTLDDRDEDDIEKASSSSSSLSNDRVHDHTTTEELRGVSLPVLRPIRTQPFFKCCGGTLSRPRTGGWVGTNIYFYGEHSKLRKFPFFCMLGPDSCVFWTWTFILGPWIGFTVFKVPDFSIPTQIASIVLFMAHVIVFLVLSLSDPGIIPKVQMSEIDLEKLQEAGVRMCTWCHIERPARAQHCYACNVCVLELDHHCPWTGKCIGKGNMFVFNLFLAFLPLSIGFMVLTAFVEAD